jgi:hypothetical protein
MNTTDLWDRMKEESAAPGAYEKLLAETATPEEGEKSPSSLGEPAADAQRREGLVSLFGNAEVKETPTETPTNEVESNELLDVPPPRPDSIVSRQDSGGMEMAVPDEVSKPTAQPIVAKPVVKTVAKKPATTQSAVAGQNAIDKTASAIQDVILANNKPENYTRAAVEIKDANGNVQGHLTNFGSFNRYPKTDGSVEWYNSAGKKVDAPNSMKQQDRQKNLAEKKYDFDRLTLEQRNKRREEYNYAMADVAARATSQLRGGQGEVKQSKNGNYYRIVRFGNTDEGGPIKDANEKMTSMGRQSRLKSIVAAIRTDKDGNPLKGERVQLRMAVEPTGGVNAKSAVEIKNIDMGRAMSQFAKAFETLNGVSEEEARNATFNSFGGKDIYGSDNPLGWKLSEKKVTPEDIAKEKIAEDARQFDVKSKMQSEQFDANMKETIRQFDATLDAKQKTALSDAYAKSQGNPVDFIKALPKEFTAGLFSSNVQKKDADGNPVYDENNAPVMESLSPVELLKRANALFDFAKVKAGVNVTPPTGAGYAITKQDAQKIDAVNELNRRGKYGKRPDGSLKGEGWLGELKLPNGGVATEYTVGVNIGGKEIDIPTLVPGLTKEEVDVMVNYIIPNNKPIPESVMQKAVEHAKQKMNKGESVFAPIATAAPASVQPQTPTAASTSTSKAQELTDKMKGRAATGGAAKPQVPRDNVAKPQDGVARPQAEVQAEIESIRRAVNGRQQAARAELTRKYKTVQDVAKDVIKTLNAEGAINSIVAPDGTRRKDLTPREKGQIISSVKQKFRDAGLEGWWTTNVEEYTQENRGGQLSQDAILDKLLKGWNNKTAPFVYGYKRN